MACIRDVSNYVIQMTEIQTSFWLVPKSAGQAAASFPKKNDHTALAAFKACFSCKTCLMNCNRISFFFSSSSVLLCCVLRHPAASLAGFDCNFCVRRLDLSVFQVFQFSSLGRGPQGLRERKREREIRRLLRSFKSG